MPGAHQISACVLNNANIFHEHPRKTKCSQNSSKALNFHSIKRNREIIQRIAILTSLPALSQYCTWNVIGRMREFQTNSEIARKDNEINARWVPTAALSYSLFPGCFQPSCTELFQPHNVWFNHVHLLQNISAKSLLRIRHQNAFLKLGQNI